MPKQSRPSVRFPQAHAVPDSPSEHPGGLPRWLIPEPARPEVALDLGKEGYLGSMALRARDLGLLVRLAVVRAYHPNMPWGQAVDVAGDGLSERRRLRQLLAQAARENAR